MIVLGAFALERPWWLLALPALALALALTKARPGALAGWARAVDAPLLEAMIARGGVGGGGDRWPPLLLALILGVLALSGPALRGPGAARLRNLDATLIVMDLSAEASESARLRVAATVAHDLRDRSAARQVGLIVYAGDAYLAAPLTDDSSGIDPLLFALDDATVPDPGARPDRALGLARKVLRESRIIRGDVVLISAGGGLDGDAARAMAAALRADGHRVDTMFVPGASPDNASETRRATALAAIAAAGGGLATPVTAPDGILAAVSGSAIQNVGASAIVALGWRDLGRYLLAAAAVPLLLGFRKATP